MGDGKGIRNAGVSRNSRKCWKALNSPIALISPSNSKYVPNPTILTVGKKKIFGSKYGYLRTRSEKKGLPARPSSKILDSCKDIPAETLYSMQKDRDIPAQVTINQDEPLYPNTTKEPQTVWGIFAVETMDIVVAGMYTIAIFCQETKERMCTDSNTGIRCIRFCASIGVATELQETKLPSTEARKKFVAHNDSTTLTLAERIWICPSIGGATIQEKALFSKNEGKELVVQVSGLVPIDNSEINSTLLPESWEAGLKGIDTEETDQKTYIDKTYASF